MAKLYLLCVIKCWTILWSLH